MSPVSSFGVAELAILAACGGLAFIVAIIAVALISTQRNRAFLADGAVNGEVAGEKSGSDVLWRYGLLALLFVIALGALILLDLLVAASLSLRFLAVYALFWILIGALLLRGAPVRRRLVILFVFVAALTAVHFVNLNSRKPFLKDFDRIEVGMSEAQVDGLMARYIKETDLPPIPMGAEGESVAAVVYRHTSENWGRADWGIVAFEEGRVARKELRSFGLGSGSTPPSPDAVGGTVRGISYVFVRWQERLAIMIWHDFSATGGGSGSGSTDDPIYRYEGYAESFDGRRFEWEVQTADGKTALFEIDGARYDLDDGRLFIVTTQEGRTRVRQLDRDLSDVRPYNDSVVDFGKNDPDVAEFADLADSP